MCAMQGGDVAAPLLNWVWTGADLQAGWGTSFGDFPLTPEEQLSHIRGVISRQGAGQGDEGFVAYLNRMQQVHANHTLEDF